MTQLSGFLSYPFMVHALIVGLLVLIAGNINSFTNNIEQDFQIQATISPGVGEEEQREALRTQIELPAT